MFDFSDSHAFRDRPARQGAPWTDQEAQHAFALYSLGVGVGSIAKELQRSFQAVAIKLVRMNAPIPQPERKPLDYSSPTGRLIDADYSGLEWRVLAHMLDTEPKGSFKAQAMADCAMLLDNLRQSDMEERNKQLLRARLKALQRGMVQATTTLNNLRAELEKVTKEINDAR